MAAVENIRRKKEELEIYFADIMFGSDNYQKTKDFDGGLQLKVCGSNWSLFNSKGESINILTYISDITGNNYDNEINKIDDARDLLCRNVVYKVMTDVKKDLGDDFNNKKTKKMKP